MTTTRAVPPLLALLTLLALAGARTLAEGLVLEAPDPDTVNAEELKGITTALKNYAAALHANDRAKALAFYPTKTDEARKLASLSIDEDLALEKLAQLVEKHFGKDKWLTLAPLVGWINPDRLDKLKVTHDEDHRHDVLIDLYPDAKEPPERRWATSLWLAPGKDGWHFGDIMSRPVSERILMRWWSRDVAAELADLNKALAEGKYPKWEDLDAAVRKLVHETTGAWQDTPEPADAAPNAPAPQP